VESQQMDYHNKGLPNSLITSTYCSRHVLYISVIHIWYLYFDAFLVFAVISGFTLISSLSSYIWSHLCYFIWIMSQSTIVKMYLVFNMRLCKLEWWKCFIVFIQMMLKKLKVTKVLLNMILSHKGKKYLIRQS